MTTLREPDHRTHNPHPPAVEIRLEVLCQVYDTAQESIKLNLQRWNSCRHLSRVGKSSLQDSSRPITRTNSATRASKKSQMTLCSGSLSGTLMFIRKSICSISVGGHRGARGSSFPGRLRRAAGSFVMCQECHQCMELCRVPPKTPAPQCIPPHKHAVGILEQPAKPCIPKRRRHGSLPGPGAVSALRNTSYPVSAIRRNAPSHLLSLKFFTELPKR